MIRTTSGSQWIFSVGGCGTCASDATVAVQEVVDTLRGNASRWDAHVHTKRPAFHLQQRRGVPQTKPPPFVDDAACHLRVVDVILYNEFVGRTYWEERERERNGIISIELAGGRCDGYLRRCPSGGPQDTCIN